MTLDSIPSVMPGCESSSLSGEAVLLDPTGHVLRGLNATGSRVWSLIDGKRSVAVIVAMVAQEFDAPAADVERDVVEFLKHLLDCRLIGIGIAN